MLIYRFSLAFSLHNIFRFLDILNAHSNEYLKWLFENSNNIIKRNTNVIYYDCTNYFFESKGPVEEYMDPITGEYINGLHQYVCAKKIDPALLLKWD